MAMSLAFDNHYIAQVATTMGWNYVSRWIGNLPIKEFPLLSHLIHYGYSGHLVELSIEIKQAVKRYPIHDQSLKSTIDGMLKLIQKNQHSARLVMVSNGMIPSRGKSTNKR